MDNGDWLAVAPVVLFGLAFGLALYKRSWRLFGIFLGILLIFGSFVVAGLFFAANFSLQEITLPAIAFILPIFMLVSGFAILHHFAKKG